MLALALGEAVPQPGEDKGGGEAVGCPHDGSHCPGHMPGCFVAERSLCSGRSRVRGLEARAARSDGEGSVPRGKHLPGAHQSFPPVWAQKEAFQSEVQSPFRK